MAPGCGLILEALEGMILPCPEVLAEELRAGFPLLCPSHALATAPDHDVHGRIWEHNTFGTAERDGERLILEDYQVEGAEWLATRWNTLISHDKGLGKTCIALMAVLVGAPVIVVCPSPVKPGWLDETKDWRPDLDPLLLSGRETFQSGPQPSQMYVINYDILPARELHCRCGHHKTDHPLGDEERVEIPPGHRAFACLRCKCAKYFWQRPTPASVRARLAILPGTILIADECQMVKRPESERTKRFRELASACDRVWGLSASPLENRPDELEHVYRSLGIFEAAFVSHKKFKSLFATFYKRSVAPTGPARAEIRERRKWVELRRTYKQVGIKLPPIRYIEKRVKLKPADLARVEELLAETIALKRTWDLVKAGDLVSPEDNEEAQAAFNEQHRLFLGTSYADEDVVAAVDDVIAQGAKSKIDGSMSTLRKALAIAKAPIVNEDLQEIDDAEESAVVFSSHVLPVQMIVAKRAGEDGAWAEISGQVSDAKKTRAIRAFRAGENPRCLAGTTRCMGVGLNLQRARFVYQIDPDWNPEWNDQAIKRVWRRGQARGCIVFVYVADHPLDRHVAKVLDIKKRLIEACAI